MFIYKIVALSPCLYINFPERCFSYYHQGQFKKTLIVYGPNSSSFKNLYVYPCNEEKYTY